VFSSSRPALALLAALLLALCAWLFTRSGTEVRDAREAPSADACVTPRDAPPEAGALANAPSQRAPATEPAADPAPAAVVPRILRPATLVQGSLIDSSDAPIQEASARVSFVDQYGQRRCSAAGQDGGYSLHELEFGTYWVTASAQGYRDLEQTLELRPDRPRMHIDFTLPKAPELRVRVTTPDGKDLFEALREARAPLAARLLVPIATREPPGPRIDGPGVGEFQGSDPRSGDLAPGCIGVLHLSCELPLCVSLVQHQVVLQTRRVAQGQDEVVFVVSPEDLLGTLAGMRVHVVDAESGLPVPCARVLLRGGSYSSGGVATDADGNASVERREPGLFDLQILAQGYERFRKSIDALPGELTDLGTVALASEQKVEGLALDLEGHPRAASFRLGLLDPLDHSLHWFPREGFAARGDGTFEIRGLGRGVYVIRTSDPGDDGASAWRGSPWVCGNVLVDTSAGPISGLELRLRPAAKLVLRASRGGGDAQRFRVEDERGFELAEGGLHGSQPRQLELPPADCRVSLLGANGAVLAQRSVTLGSQATAIDFDGR
jgi:hypothetical protein